jgi:hypothetical protein
MFAARRVRKNFGHLSNHQKAKIRRSPGHPPVAPLKAVHDDQQADPRRDGRSPRGHPQQRPRDRELRQCHRDRRHGAKQRAQGDVRERRRCRAGAGDERAENCKIKQLRPDDHRLRRRQAAGDRGIDQVKIIKSRHSGSASV